MLIGKVHQIVGGREPLAVTPDLPEAKMELGLKTGCVIRSNECDHVQPIRTAALQSSQTRRWLSGHADLHQPGCFCLNDVDVAAARPEPANGGRGRD